MSAFVGFLPFHTSPAPPGAAMARAEALLAERTSGELATIELPEVCGRLRSFRAGDLHVGERYVVQFDGALDWVAGTDVRDADCAAAPARVIAELVAAGGFSWLERAQGSFAFACVDRQTRRVTLVRDRYGTKPMLYARTAAGWVWGSQARALVPFVDRVEIDRAALAEAVHYRWLVGDRKLVGGVRQVMPTFRVELSADGREVTQRYWTLHFEPDAETSVEVWGDRVEAALRSYFDRLGKRYKKVGILLSGGVDSSLLAALARDHFGACVAVTPRWHHGDNPELSRARDFAAHLGIEHILPEVDDGYILATYQRVCRDLEQPPRHYHAVALARALDAMPGDVDAVIYGEAADTLFGSGPVRQLRAFLRRRTQAARLPEPLRRAVADLMPRRPGRWSRLRGYLTRDLADFLFSMHAMEAEVPADRVFPRVPAEARPNAQHVARLLPHHEDPMSFAQAHLLYTAVTNHFELIDRLGAGERFDILHPFVCNDDMELARALPQELLLDDDGVPKPVLRELACRYLRREWIYTQKIGFTVPTLRWLTGPLGGEFSLLDDPHTRDRGVVDVDALRQSPLEPNYEHYFTAISLERVARHLLD